jgi:hypothetical protein
MDTVSHSNPSIRPLQIIFTGKGEVRGFKFTQLRQTDKAFVYEVNSGDTIYYEVFKKTVNKRYNCISYPTSKGFGKWSWTHMDIESALVKFNLLNTHD